MADSSSQRTKAFISYSHKDRKFLNELEEHLAYFERQGRIQYWDDQKLNPGDPWEEEINQAINSTKVAIFLISRSFLASDFINRKELLPLLEAAQKEGTLLLLVIVRPCLFKHTTLAKFQAVHDTSKPLSDMKPSERDRIWVKVAELVAKAFSEQSQESQPEKTLAKTPKAPVKTAEQWLEEALSHRIASRSQEALTAYEQAMKLDPGNAAAQFGRGNILWILGRTNEARIIYKHAFRLVPNDLSAYHTNKGTALYHLRRYQEALEAYDQAIQLNPNDAIAYNNKGLILEDRGQYQDGLQAYEQAIACDPKFSIAWHYKGDALKRMGKTTEARRAYKKARELGWKE